MTSHGHFHWNELMTNNVEQARSFYHDTLGWEFDSVDMGPGGIYWLAMDGETPIGGMFEMTGENFEGMTDQWIPYIAVDDIDKRAADAKKQGATIIMEPTDIPNTGRIATMKEPGGAMVGWMQPAD